MSRRRGAGGLKSKRRKIQKEPWDTSYDAHADWKCLIVALICSAGEKGFRSREEERQGEDKGRAVWGAGGGGGRFAYLVS